MTQTELEKLSKDVAAKCGLKPYREITYTTEIWLHQDSAFCFELMVSEKIDVYCYDDFASCYCYEMHSYPRSKKEPYADHNNDANQATRAAILKAYLAKEE